MARKYVLYIILVISISMAFVIPVAATSGQWSANGSSIYYNDGRLGIGTSGPADPLHILNTNPSSPDYNTGKALLGDGVGSWWIQGNTYNGQGMNNIVSNGYFFNGWNRRTSNNESWIMSNYVTSNNTGYFRIYHSDAQPGSAITNLKALMSISSSGSMSVREVVVSNTWSDYVFNNDYNLKPLGEVSKYIDENKHLENIPSSADVEKDGISVGDMQAKQMAKIEELTLYVIQLQKQIDELKVR